MMVTLIDPVFMFMKSLIYWKKTIHCSKCYQQRGNFVPIDKRIIPEESIAQEFH